MPRKKSGIASTATCHGAMTCSSNRKSTSPASVPKVPGARGASPLPNPRAMKCAGCDSRKRASGALEVVVSAAIDLHGFAVGTQQAHALAPLDLADARERHGEHLLQVLDALARIGVGGEAQLVVVAARE